MCNLARRATVRLSLMILLCIIGEAESFVYTVMDRFMCLSDTEKGRKAEIWQLFLQLFFFFF